MASAYSSSQIAQYLDLIGLPAKYVESPTRDLEYLTVLHAHQISTIPYENLSLHYSRTKEVSLDPQTLFQKFMKNGRGGYCMEVSIFYYHVLRALGFNTYMTGVKIRLREGGVPQGDYIGWVHIVNLVTLDGGTKYMVDTAFGGDGATKPIPLIEGHITPNIGTQELRLKYDVLPEATTQQKWWIYQYRNTPEQEWNSFYAFGEMEFLHTDFKIMNYFTSHTSFQTYTVLMVKFLRRQEEDVARVYGKVMLVNGEVKVNTGGKTSVAKVCETEEERIGAIKKYFGITLTEEEKAGIKDYRTDLDKK